MQQHQHILAWLNDVASDLHAIRHDIHAHPELGFEESRTAVLVAQLLKDWGYEVHTGIGKTGVVGVLRNGSSPRKLGLRADMDALPIHEATGAAYSSRHQGCMYACGLPSSRQDAKGQQVRYEYDKAVRLTALVNENSMPYRFAYDASDPLIEEVRVDNLTRRFTYNDGGHLTRLDEIGYGENGEQPQRETLFERDPIGRLRAKLNRDARQDYAYDDVDRLLSIQGQPSGIGKQLGIIEEKLEYAYDLLGRLTQETTPQGVLGYEYDPLSNLTTLTLPDGRKVNHLYYGSGHLHQLNLDGQVISDMERDDLHREVFRTQGKLTSCFGYDAMGRKAWQFASTLPAEKLSQVHNTGINTSLLVEHAYNPIHRRYQYDPAGELVRTLDKLRGEIKYEYEANGQLHSRDTGSLVGSEEFRYDPAANRLDFNARQLEKVKDNRIKRWRDQEYRYDPWAT